MTDVASLYRSLAEAGWVMIPIAFCSIYSIALVVERAWALRRGNVAPPSILASIRGLMREKKVSEVLALCRANDTAATRALAAGLEVLHLDRAAVVDEFERAGKREILALERNLTILGTLAAGGPLLGLFGTVTGMIQIFAQVKRTGIGDPLELSGGISEALLCTAGGMIIGMPALAFHRHFVRRVDEVAVEIESLCQDALLYLKDGR